MSGGGATDIFKDVDPLRPPPWVLGRPEVRRKGIDNLPHVPKPYIVFSTRPNMDCPQWVVKIVVPGSSEVEIYEHLLKNDISSPGNHILPIEIVRSEPPILIMPGCRTTGRRHFRWTLSAILDDFYQIVEGIEYLHQNHVAHMDLVFDNTTVATDATVKYHKQLKAGKIYIIDFGLSQKLPSGPGEQLAVDIGDTTLSKHLGISRLDPYSWDVLCLGHTLLYFLQVTRRTSRSTPWICTRYAQWLVGQERGCMGVCRCRPTARRALHVLAVIRWFAHRWDACARAVGYVVGLCGLSRR
ncbi:hypothetical protein C8Q80DRAFT_644845 [Daedaleopsis nitida]|nr:hypothetical protein C8Q80DRAFT_644845 [Daedaleopsis nitida]